MHNFSCNVLQKGHTILLFKYTAIPLIVPENIQQHHSSNKAHRKLVVS